MQGHPQILLFEDLLLILLISQKILHTLHLIRIPNRANPKVTFVITLLTRHEELPRHSHIRKMPVITMVLKNVKGNYLF
jgi:hypothetical protein